MATIIHPTAIVSPSAQLGENVSIGAFSIVEDNVIIGDNTEISYHTLIGKRTVIGSGNKIYSKVVIGTDPQDLKYKGEETRTTIGNNNLIREFVSINNGTGEQGHTIVGDNNCLLAYTHIAHDNHFGNRNVMSNLVQLAGHVTVEDGITFGGLAAIHQFCRVGKFSMIGAGAIVTKDAPPFSLIDREPAWHGVNKVGLMRRGFASELIKEISDFYIAIFRSGMNNTAAINNYIASHTNIAPDIQYAIDFIRTSERGVLR
ncbi:MAG: acyl-ACP--UDP-N-acetylglucosamine O-acyltransferase [Ignavibacteria bacterium]|jgi:UDP-N-acetylglucosamine acyltransferase|nr:acyl-ACP--UDP-N-acetylglucosamine O-acyltransferase [Ignavibacteria bacterium]